MLMAEFATAVKYQLPIKVVVIKNNTLGQIKWEQMVFLGNPEYACELQPIDFAAVARACGGIGFAIDDPKECGRVLDEFLAAPGPAVLQAAVDPFSRLCRPRLAPNRRCTLPSRWRAASRTAARSRLPLSPTKSVN